jgi:ResB-like family
MDQTGIQTGTAGPKASETGVSTGPPPIGTNGTITEAPAESAKVAKQPLHPAYQVLVWLADLRITVALFALALVLVFWGTLAQTDAGVWTVVQKYFRSAVVLVPLKVVLFNGVNDTKTVLPFPGGWLIGGVMLVNLLAAHAIRFKLTWNRSGILLIHAGIIVMMFGELITGLYAVEGQMVIPIGKFASNVIDARSSELAIIRRFEDDPKKDDVVTIPSRLLKTGAAVEDEKVPFRIVVVEFMANSKLRDEPKNNKGVKGFGRFHVADDVPEVSGVDPNQKLDLPSAYMKLFNRAGEELGTWLFSTLFEEPQWITVDGKDYQVLLRYKQTTRKFKIHLKDFKHDVFPGTTTPKDFHSYIILSDPTNGVEREVEIWMNHPLYYDGETFYQSSWTMDQNDKANGTILQVVRNPGWLLPYISCAIVGFGLLIHFGLTLYRFIDRRIVR